MSDSEIRWRTHSGLREIETLEGVYVVCVWLVLRINSKAGRL